MCRHNECTVSAQWTLNVSEFSKAQIENQNIQWITLLKFKVKVYVQFISTSQKLLCKVIHKETLVYSNKEKQHEALWLDL